MPKKKDFTSANTSRVYDAMKEATAPVDDYDAQRIQEIENASKKIDDTQQRIEEQEAQQNDLIKNTDANNATNDAAPPKRTPGRPKKPKDDKKAIISFFVTPSTYQDIKRLAHYRQTTAGNLIDSILAAYLEAHRDELNEYENFSRMMREKNKE